MLIICKWFRILLAERRNIFIVTYLLCAQLALAFGEDNSVKHNNQHHSDGRWYDKSKWSNSASTQSSHISNVEGSGASDVVSDLDEGAKGLGPDDEDSDDTGSGNGNVHESPAEGSGAGPVKFQPELHTTTTTSTAFYLTHLTTSSFINATLDPSFVTESSFASSTAEPRSDFKHLTAAPATTLSATTLRTGVDIEDIDDEDEDDEEEDDEDDEAYDDLEPGAATLTPPVVDVGHPPPPSIDLDHQPSLPPTTPVDLHPTTQFEVPPPAVDVPSATLAPTQRPPHDMYDETAPGDRHSGGDDTGDRFNFDWLLNPGVLTAVIGGGFVGLLAFILLLMVVVYRMRKKDEGSYVLEEPKAPPTYPYAYQKAPAREFYA